MELKYRDRGPRAIGLAGPVERGGEGGVLVEGTADGSEGCDEAGEDGITGEDGDEAAPVGFAGCVDARGVDAEAGLEGFEDVGDEKSVGYGGSGVRSTLPVVL